MAPALKTSLKSLSVAQVRAIEAVASHGTFSTAAKRLGVSQPSVSNHVTSVETQFRVQLFERRGHQAVPTAMLNGLLPRLRTMLMLLDEVEHELHQHRALEGGQLRVGYSTYQVAVPILTRFMRNHPSVQVEAKAMASHDLLARLEQGDLDVACLSAREVPSHLAGMLLRRLKIVLAVPKAHPFAALGRVDLQALEGQALIQREKTSGTRRVFDARASVLQVPVRTILAVGSWGSISELVRAGVGLGIGLDAEVRQSPGLVAVDINDAALHVSQFLVYLPERKMVSGVQAFLASAQQVVAHDNSLTSGNP